MAVVPRRAVRTRTPLKIALTGPSGSGKTYSALQIARGIGDRVVMIDTEAGSGSLYAHLYDYDVVDIDAPFQPTKCVDAVTELAPQYDVIIIDSISPFWNGRGGILEMKEVIAQSSPSQNGWAAWAKVTPIYNNFLRSLIEAPVHIIVTMRSKTQWVVESGTGDRTRPVKVGTEPVAREGIEYEFTTVFSLDQSHNAMATKDRMAIFDNQIFVPGPATGRTMIEWVNGATSAPVSRPPPESEPQTTNMATW
jgi:hypothetical protein